MDIRNPASAAEVSHKPISVYNWRVMRVAKHTYTPLVLVLSLGLMYLQVCNVICAFSNCSAPITSKRAATVEHGGHCHQAQTSSQKIPQKEQPPEGHHKCPAHGSAVLILPSETISAVVSHCAWQTEAAELVSSFDLCLDPAGSGTGRGGRFRSPPRQPQFTILRI